MKCDKCNHEAEAFAWVKQPKRDNQTIFKFCQQCYSGTQEEWNQEPKTIPYEM